MESVGSSNLPRRRSRRQSRTLPIFDVRSRHRDPHLALKKRKSWNWEEARQTLQRMRRNAGPRDMLRHTDLPPLYNKNAFSHSLPRLQDRLQDSRNMDSPTPSLTKPSVHARIRNLDEDPLPWLTYIAQDVRDGFLDSYSQFNKNVVSLPKLKFYKPLEIDTNWERGLHPDRHVTFVDKSSLNKSGSSSIYRKAVNQVASKGKFKIWSMYMYVYLIYR